MAAAFCAEHIAQRYGRREILTDCTIEADRGECIGIAGRNGSGKSTFLQIIAGGRRPAGGVIRYEGKEMHTDPGRISRIAAYVPQHNPLIEELTAEQNLQLMSGRKVSSEDPVCRKLKIDEFFRMKVASLSGGMKRRLAIACALTEHQTILVMDEPTSALDLYHKAIIYDYLKDYTKSGGIVVMATHDIEEMTLCDRLYLITGGISEVCLPEEAIQKIKGVQL